MRRFAGPADVGADHLRQGRQIAVKRRADYLGDRPAANCRVYAQPAPQRRLEPGR